MQEQLAVPPVPIMGMRRDGLQRALDGYEYTGMRLVGYDGARLWPEPYEDNLGSYYFIPEIVRLLGVSLDTGIQIFYVGLILLSFAVGLAGTLLLCRTGLGRVAAFCGLSLVSLLAYLSGDVYILLSASVLMVVPWFLWFHRRGGAGPGFAAFLLAAGALLGTSEVIRGHSGVAVMIFVAVALLATTAWPWSRRLALLACAVIGFVLPGRYFQGLLEQREAYLRTREVAAASGQSVPVLRRHLGDDHFWHSIYIGLGYVPNRYGIRYDDNVGLAKVRTVVPDAEYLGDTYVRVLRAEVLRLVREDPGFVATNVVAKIGAVLWVLLRCLNFGLIGVLFYRISWNLQAAFAGALGFSALPSIIVIPTPRYLLGFVALATVYAVVHIDNAVAGGAVERVRGWVRRRRAQ